MSYYRFNRQEILQKVKERYSKENAAEYYFKNKEAIKEKTREQYKNFSQEEKDKIKEYQKKKKKKKKRYQQLIQCKKEALQNKRALFLPSIKMSQKTKLGLIRKNFINLKQPIDSMSANTEHIVTSGKFKHSDEGFKYFIRYREDELLNRMYYLTSNEWIHKIF